MLNPMRDRSFTIAQDALLILISLRLIFQGISA